NISYEFNLFFFFQAEDGIRDRTVTGVQTCALPIWIGVNHPFLDPVAAIGRDPHTDPVAGRGALKPGMDVVECRGCGRSRRGCARSEERRVGKEWRWRWV